MFSLKPVLCNGVLKYNPLKGGGCGERLFRVHEENQLFINVGLLARQPDQTFDKGANCQNFHECVNKCLVWPSM